MKVFRLLLLLWLPLTSSAQNASPAGAPDLLIIEVSPALSTATDRFGKEVL
jgi:hypothetical protein